MDNAREQTLIGLLIAGHTDTSAARRLNVSPRTVTTMVRHMMDRFSVNNRFQLGVSVGMHLMGRTGDECDGCLLQTVGSPTQCPVAERDRAR